MHWKISSKRLLNFCVHYDALLQSDDAASIMGFTFIFMIDLNESKSEDQF